MDLEHNKSNSSSALLFELKSSIKKLKLAAKEQYDKCHNLTEDEYELAYARGYYFGQLAALEDCFNLFEVLLYSSKKEDKITIEILKQQIFVLVKIVEDISIKIKNNEPTEKIIDSVQNVVSLIKNNIENLNG